VTSTQTRNDQRDAARTTLREMFPVGSTVHTQLLHVSRSGMLRSVAVLYADGDGIRDVSGLVARATGSRLHQPTGGVSMGGAGMDMGFALVYNLAHALYPDGQPCTGSDGYGIGDGPRCTSNDHVNERGDAYRDGFRVGRVHSDSGYALSHRWI
jgi:hypothetical protein